MTLLLGLAGIAILVVALIFLAQGFDVVWLIAGILSGVDILLVVVYGYRILSSIAKVKRVPSYCEAELNEDHVMLRVYKNGEQVSENKFYYRSIAFYRLLSHYPVAVISKAEFFPIERKEELLSLLDSKGVKRK